MSVCSNCGKSTPEKYRKLCWTCTNWKRKYGTVKKEEVTQKKDARRTEGKRECAWCGRKSTQVVPGEYTSTGKSMCVGCSWAAGVLKEALNDPVKMYGLKDRLGWA